MIDNNFIQISKPTEIDANLFLPEYGLLRLNIISPVDKTVCKLCPNGTDET